MTTVAELYQQVLGREPDAAGLAYWTQRLGIMLMQQEKVHL